MRKLAFIALLLSTFFISLRSVSAHVFIPDESKTKGAILHIIPDDDPIAGQESTLYFDAQNMGQGTEVKLTITDSSAETKTVAVKTEGSLSTANYVFPTQGVYQVVFTVKASGQTYTFKQVQRVSRGVSTSALDKPDHTWAKLALLISGVSLLVLLIVAVNRHMTIAKQSVL